MRPHYRQLTDDDRLVIESLLADGLSLRAVAARVGVHASTVCRERQRGLLPGFDRYLSVIGQRSRQAGRSRAGLARRKLGTDARSSYWPLVLPYLRQGWSPQQIAGRLRDMSASPSISHETIYRFIYAQIRRTKSYDWRHYLPRAKSKRGYRPNKRGFAQPMQCRVSIDKRPESANNRQTPGHWESDLIAFATYGQIILAAHERSSRFMFITRQPSKAADPTAKQLIAWLKPLPNQLRRSVTFDNGTEFAQHHQLHTQLKTKTYFCDTRSPWQKGGVENAIGRLRRFLPRKTNLDDISPDIISACATAYNNTPRKCLDFLTPAEAFHNQLLHFKCESTFPPSRE